MCEKAVEDEPEPLEYVPDLFKTEEICKEAVRRKPYALGQVPDNLKTKKCVKKLMKKTHGSCMLPLAVLKFKIF